MVGCKALLKFSANMNKLVLKKKIYLDKTTENKWFSTEKNQQVLIVDR